jgi:ribosomal protein S27AE/1-acyl-sn-glycerol-3-phosphate acyltransferase
MQEKFINKIPYKKTVTPFEIGKEPVKIRGWVIVLVKIIVFFGLLKQKHKIDRVDMDSLKGKPYFLLCNHMQFLDFFIMYQATEYGKLSSVVSLDAYRLLPYWLIQWGGSICKRKYTNELIIVRNLVNAVHKNQIPVVFPEAHYTYTGYNDVLPDSIGKCAKTLRVPLVTCIFEGHSLVNPVWGNQKPRKLPVHATIKQIVTEEELQKLSVEEINQRINDNFVYDEYEYLKKNNLKVTEDYRAEGLELILYKCPHCGNEHSLSTHGIHLTCSKCHADYILNEDYSLSNTNGETLYNTIRSWTDFERASVRKEIEDGTYRYEVEAIAWSIPTPKTKPYLLGLVHVIHDYNGFVLTGNYNDTDFEFTRTPLDYYGLHIELNFPSVRYKGKKPHVFAISTKNESIYVMPNDSKEVYKLDLATEELYKYLKEKTNQI